MMGLWASHSHLFLLTIGILVLVAFAVPMTLSPIGWAKLLRWRSPDHTDLAVYFGRCLGCVATVIAVFSIRAASRPEMQLFFFEFLLAGFVLITAVHIYGAFRKIQPMTETLEIAFWSALVVLTLIFWPASV